VPQPVTDVEHVLPLASVVAFLTVAEALVFAPARVAEYRDSVVDNMRARGVPNRVVKRSVEYGQQVAKHVLAWAATDKLKQARALPRFEVRREPGRWVPTPPAYMDALEPNWQTLRPFVMDSANSFRPPVPQSYAMRAGSEFLVRPETVINEAIDPKWRPLLQTPPFPEYPSGHSVISAAAAEVLTGLFGDDFAFDDDVEVRFGLPVRSFPSFRRAAEEAAISRLYGGIHYPMAIANGAVQGRALGQSVLARVETRSERLGARWGRAGGSPLRRYAPVAEPPRRAVD